MRAMIDAGAAGVHFEDQLASVKKCGHMGGKVLVPTREAVQKLIAARLAADVADVPTLLLARTDAEAANLVTSDIDENDKPFLTGERTAEGFYRVRNGIEQAIARGLAYAEYADMVLCETGTPDLDFARKFSEAIREKFPQKMLAYNCSPSFNWKRNLDDATIAKFQRELGAMGYKFQFITLAGFHSLNYSMFELAYGYARSNMSAFVELQQKEFAAAEKGFTAVKHQREVGTGYFDEIMQVVTAATASTPARPCSTAIRRPSSTSRSGRPSSSPTSACCMTTASRNAPRPSTTPLPARCSTGGTTTTSSSSGALRSPPSTSKAKRRLTAATILCAPAC